jgi:hypothetical protein
MVQKLVKTLRIQYITQIQDKTNTRQLIQLFLMTKIFVSLWHSTIQLMHVEILIKGKWSSSYNRAWRPRGEYRYSCNLSLTLALGGDGWCMALSGCFIPGKEAWYPFYRRLIGPGVRPGWVQKISPPPQGSSPGLSSRWPVTILAMQFQPLI